MEIVKKIAKQKGVTILHDSHMKTLEAYRRKTSIGILEYSITTDTYTIYVLRSRMVQKETLCMNVKNVNVIESEKGKRIGSLLFSYAIFIALANNCKYIILDDMSNNARNAHHNIYSKFGAVFKDLTLHPSDDVIINSGPEKQLQLLHELDHIRTITKILS